MATWDVTLPTDNESEKLGDDRIRDTKAILQTALQADCIFPGPDPTNPVCLAKIGYGSTAARPAATAANAGRWFFNTDTKTIQRNDTSPAWVDLTAASDLVPSGSNMIFYQSTAPGGWTQIVDASIDDRALRVTIGTGQSVGGTDSISSPPFHTHGSGSTGSGNLPAHAHAMTAIEVDIAAGGASKLAPAFTDTMATTTDVAAAVGHTHGLPSSSSQGFTPGYVDVILATKN